MSILHVNQIASKIKELFENKIDFQDIPQNDADRETKILTRCLAAYAIYVLMDCTDNEAALSVTDGGDDNGIDAVYYSSSLRQMVIVQSKWNKKGIGEPDSGEVGKFCKGIRDLFNLSFDRFNRKINDKRTVIEHALREYDTKYILILIDTGDRGLADHGQRQIDDLLSEMNDAGEGIQEQLVSFQRLNQGKIHSSLALSVAGAPIDLEIGLAQWGKIDEPNGAFFGMVAGEEIAEWWKNYGRRLFERNIRQVLGSTDVNNEIQNTLRENPSKFWYFNNGITIVAENIEKSMIGGTSRDNGTFRLQRAQIVNGAQTVSAIGKYSESSGAGLDKVWVHTRIISLSNSSEEFGTKVTRANNRQNRIENRDFVSQDPEQVRIKTELAIDGVDYNIVRSDAFKPTEKSFDLQEATVALACASGQPTLAVQAKREIGKFYEDLNKAIYKTIFNPTTTGAYTFNCVNIVRTIDEYLEKKISELSKKSGRKYGMLVHGNRILSLLVIKRLNLSQAAKRSDFILDKENVEATTEEFINKMFDYLESNYPDSMLGTLFKNATKCRDVAENCV